MDHIESMLGGGSGGPGAQEDAEEAQEEEAQEEEEAAAQEAAAPQRKKRGKRGSLAKRAQRGTDRGYTRDLMSMTEIPKVLFLFGRLPFPSPGGTMSFTRETGVVDSQLCQP